MRGRWWGFEGGEGNLANVFSSFLLQVGHTGPTSWERNGLVWEGGLLSAIAIMGPMYVCCTSAWNWDVPDLKKKGNWDVLWRKQLLWKLRRAWSKKKEPEMCYGIHSSNNVNSTRDLWKKNNHTAKKKKDLWAQYVHTAKKKSSI